LPARRDPNTRWVTRDELLALRGVKNPGKLWRLGQDPREAPFRWRTVQRGDGVWVQEVALSDFDDLMVRYSVLALSRLEEP
jgi:hypothetical protein